MKILKHILLFLFFLILNNSTCHASTRCGDAEFRTGEEYWAPSKLQYHLTVAGQLRKRHSRYDEMDIFNNMIEMDKKNELYCPIVYKINCIEGVTLELALSPGGSAQLQLFLAFNEAMVEILDTFGDIYDKSKYVRSDLETMQKYSAETLTFLKRVEHSTKHIFKSSNDKFNEKKFLEFLDNTYVTHYTEASVFNRGIIDWETNVKRNHNGIITTEQYLAHYVDVYLKWFTNQYIFLKAHLRSYDKATCNQLNRKIEGGLKDFSFILSVTNTMNSLDPGFSNAEKSPNKTNKGNRKNNKKINASHGSKKRNIRNKSQNISSTTQTAPSTKQNKNQTLVSKTEKITDVVETLPEIMTGNSLKIPVEIPIETKEVLEIFSADQLTSGEPKEDDGFVESAIISSLGMNKSDADLLSDISLNLSPLTEEMANLSLSQELSELREKEKSYQKEKEKGQSASVFQESASKIKELNNVLNEFDGGPTAGMKTRKFLKLCEALNKLGYFSEFSANEKEVKIKTDGMVTVIHTNHSGNQKNPGMTNNSVNKLKEVIEEIKK